MKKFVTRVVFFLLVLTLISGGIIQAGITFWPGYFLAASTDYALCTYQYAQINKKSPCKNIIIGDSRGLSGVDPRLLGNGKSWTNFCLPGSDFFEGYITMQHYLAEGNQLDTVIMAYGLDRMEGKTIFFDIRTVALKFPTPVEMDNLDSIERKYCTGIHSNKPSGKAQLLVAQFERKLKYMHFPFSYRETFLDALKSFAVQRFENNKAKTALAINHMKETSGQFNIGLGDSCGENFFKNPLYDPIDVNTYSYKFYTISEVYFDLIMQLVAQKHIKTMLFIAPFNKTSYDIYKNSFYQKSVARYIGCLQARYPQLMAVVGPGYLPNNCFGDVTHANKRGTIFFTKAMKEGFENAGCLR